jgi:hypothetical protein
MELRDVRKLSREKMGGEHKIPWLLCKRISSTDKNENLSVVGKGRNQEVRVCLSRTAGISLDDNTALQKYLGLVDWYSLDIFPSEFEPQENMKCHTNFSARGLKQKQPVTTQENSDDESKTPEADTQRSFRDWYIQVQADGRMLRKAVCDPTECKCRDLLRCAGQGTPDRDSWLCPWNLVRASSADLDGFLRGLALWLNEGIETGRWGNGAEEAPHPTDSENLLLSEIVKDDSNRGRVELKGSTRHAHLDVNGMDIHVEPEDSATNGELHKVIVDGAPKPIDPIMAVMGILLRVEAVLKESDTCMQDGVETSWWKLTDARPSVATLQQARQLLLTRLKRCRRGHRLSTICRKCTTPGC